MEQEYSRPEIWGGIECTINRLASGFIDQVELSGHYDREDDLDAIASLGIKKLRYPVLWEKHQPKKNSKPDFSWAASRLEKLSQLGVDPIIGLIHHGSGPEFTNLADPEFPKLLASYAEKVATAFPWVKHWTPVNEPLTTARFSGLYGHWFPHETNDVSFARMLLNQLKGVVLSMRAIRKIIPDAKLIQTEDLGKTYSTPLLKYQADWENRRRWLTWDILCGTLKPGDVFWEHFIRLGITAAELEFFTENPCPPDIIGINHYVTSERYLDQNIRNYPAHTRGGNTIHSYSDVEAVRVRLKVESGFSHLATEVWERYQIPLAVTEAHLHCSREEQMKWFRDIYESSQSLAKSGVNIIAVTAWSLLGAYGWNKLLTEPNGEYEKGTFDVSSGKLRPTAMAKMLKTLCETGEINNEIIKGDGWWKRENRFFTNKSPIWENSGCDTSGRPLIIIGKTGTLGRALSRICNIRSLHHVLIGRDQVDICHARQIESIISDLKPWAIINAAGYVRVDDAEREPERCFNENTLGPKLLASACEKAGIRFMTFSSDLVFDGNSANPYVESDPVNPMNVYGKSKAHAEIEVLNANPASLVIRTSAFFGPWDKYNFVHAVLDTLSAGNEFHASDDIVSPTYVPHMANAALDLLIDGESGIWHLANSGETSWINLAVDVARRAGLDESLVQKSVGNLPAPRPKYSAIKSEKGLFLPSLESGLDCYFSEVISRGKIAIQL